VVVHYSEGAGGSGDSRIGRSGFACDASMGGDAAGRPWSTGVATLERLRRVLLSTEHGIPKKWVLDYGFQLMTVNNATETVHRKRGNNGPIQADPACGSPENLVAHANHS